MGHLCRDSLPDRWLRIHSLPRGKRYPETQAEYVELLLRQNTVATAVLAASAECVLFFCDFPDEPELSLPNRLSMTFPEPVWVPELASLTDAYEQLRIGAVSVTWQHGTFDDLLRGRADGRLVPFLFVNLAAGTAFAPYDGGVDLFLKGPDDVTAARRRWPAWLSPRPDQL